MSSPSSHAAITSSHSIATSSASISVTTNAPAAPVVTHAIEKVSKERWVEAVKRLKEGHSYRGQGSGSAIVTSQGCILPLKAVNRKEHGYIQIDAPKLTDKHRTEPNISPQLATRVICFLTKPAAEVKKMLYEGYQTQSYML